MISTSDNKVSITDGVQYIDHKFDSVIGSKDENFESHHFVQEAISNLLQTFSNDQSFNSTIMSYGESGSGKSRTLFGENWDQQIKILQKVMLTKGKEEFEEV